MSGTAPPEAVSEAALAAAVKLEEMGVDLSMDSPEDGVAVLDALEAAIAEVAGRYMGSAEDGTLL